MIEKYYFLFALAIVWMIFAVVQDIRKREVANWLNFSLIAFALAYRVFYSAFSGEWSFFGFGLAGFIGAFALAHGFYYSRVFAGGDAKLFMALGAVLPYGSLSGLLYEGLGFVFVLFVVGLIWSLIYSVYLVSKKWGSFRQEFRKHFRKMRGLFVVSLVLIVLAFLFLDMRSGLYVAIALILLPLLFIYLAAVEQGCMVGLKAPGKLTEGDWLEKNVKVGRNRIEKSVHGLSFRDIKLLRKAKKKVLIKEGVPFTPAFLISFVAMVCVWVVLGFRFQSFFSSLF
jgi:Flp pilus assembly protein protease CpaA